MDNHVRAVALSLFIAVIAIGIAIASLASFIATMSALQVAAWITSCVLAFLAGFSVWRISFIQHRSQPDVIDADTRPAVPALPEPRWVATGERSYARSDVLDAKAMQIGQLLRDRRLEPTRANIKACGMEIGVAGNEAASMIYRRFVEWEWADSVAQGQPGRWRDGN